MITNRGTEILSKYLLGQTLNYATHVSAGIGAQVNSEARISNVTAIGISGTPIAAGDPVPITFGTIQETIFYPGDHVNFVGFPAQYSEFNGIRTVISVEEPNIYYVDNPYNTGSVTYGTFTDPFPTAQLCVRGYTNMKFEAARYPIVSRGFVYDEGQNKLSFIAEVDAQDTISITEVGLWSGARNTIAAGSDSRMMFDFTFDEGWQYHLPDQIVAIPIKLSPLDNGPPFTGEIIPPDITGTATPAKIFGTTSENSVFSFAGRVLRQEAPRYLLDSFVLQGDSSDLISGTPDDLTDSHIHLIGQGFDFNKNNPSDLLKLAFSVAGTTPNNSDSPGLLTNVYIRVEFLDSETSPTSYAYWDIKVPASEFYGSAYHVSETPLSGLTTSPGFDWTNIRTTKIYACVTTGTEGVDEAPSPNFWVILDAMRFDNITTLNPLYVMTGYSVVQSVNDQPIKKFGGTSAFIEFRFALGAD